MKKMLLVAGMLATAIVLVLAGCSAITPIAPTDPAGADIEAPVAGDAISFAGTEYNNITVSWGAAADNRTVGSMLMYKVVRAATIEEINTVALASAITGTGIAKDWTSDIRSVVITDMAKSTSYAYAVLVRDLAGNVTLYAPATKTTGGDNIAPSVGAAISFASVNATGMTVNWGAATDDSTAQGSLEYSLWRSTSVMASIAQAEAATEVLAYSTNVLTKVETGLTTGTTYHYAVVVRDALGNKALYADASQVAAVLTFYPSITVDTTQDADWTDAAKSIALTDGDTGACGFAKDFDKLYVTNDAQNLYVAIKLKDKGTNNWEKELHQVILLIDSDSSAATGNTNLHSAGSFATDGFNLGLTGFGAELGLRFGWSNAGFVAKKFADGSDASGVVFAFNQTTSGDYAEMKIPLSNLTAGSGADANKLKLIFAHANSWGAAPNNGQIMDLYPKTSGGSTGNDQNSAFSTDSALSYTLRFGF